ncbi:zinc-dependent metalloprotease [Streptomyces sp. SP17KL33]|uniref:zinc-dependent metalloprotease n=1 Tax=Streptomyces sp. SP17KL33 TaxID=3002534 RepID=UPI002E75D6DC|nr:zinc-dependent metalloprotease [Streptomyces sp. SP17KL33]MEE1829704.1 zinc-dependent metalloprotease [Streptomyces sp. SP17KL33]
MTEVSVLNETAAHDRLAQHMYENLSEAAPYVEKITGLHLPAIITVKLVTVDGFATAHGAFVRRQIERDTEGRQLTERQRMKAAALPEAAAVSARALWMVEEPVLTATSDGRPVTLIVPEALHHLGLADVPDLVYDAMVRILAQQVQVAACEGALVPAPEWPPVVPRKDPITQLSNGHAQWTSTQVTTHILGRPVDRAQRRRPRTFLLQRAFICLMDPIAGTRLNRATALVDRAVSTVGLDTFNRVWTTDGLVPTLAEFRSPDRWIERLRA